MSDHGTILAAEDQQSARESMAELLREEGYEALEAPDGDSAMALIDRLDIDLVLLDLVLPGSDGITVLRHIRERSLQPLVILMTAHASVETAVEAIRLGAQDYLLKPLLFEDVLRKVQRLLSHRKLLSENELLRRELTDESQPERPLGRSHAMQPVSAMIQKVAATPATVLITGETGVGKEVVARMIHANSLSKENIFLPVNCSAIP